MTRPKIKWTEEEKDVLLDYYLSLDGMTNQEKLRKTWNDLYNIDNKFGHYRNSKNVETYISIFLKERKIEIPFAYKKIPKGFHLIPKSNYHYMNNDMKVLNAKSGAWIKITNTYDNRKKFSMIENDIRIRRSASRVYVELFLDENKPYQVQENGIPIQTEKGKKRGIGKPKLKSFNEWLV